MGLEIVELIMRLEEEFEIEIPDEDAEKLVALGQIADYLALRLQIVPEKRDELWQRLQTIVIDELHISPALVRREARLVEDLDLD